MSDDTPTLFITLDEGRRNERTRSMRGLVQALLEAATPTRPVLELRALAGGGLVCPGASTPVQMRPGDTLLIAACGWLQPHFLTDVATAKAQGARIVVLVHDLARMRRPEWYPPRESQQFRQWVQTLLGIADQVLVPSLATAKDITLFCREAGLGDIHTIRIRLGDGTLVEDAEIKPPACPITERFVLVAGPIEIRLNHVVLVEAWRRLAARLKPEELPRLVFAGSIGPLSQDMRDRLARGNQNQIQLLLDPDEAMLAVLYRQCEFSIFPALYEGWGIAVTESLCFGKPVFAAKAMALPEAGGRLARYFDPLDPEDTSRHIERVLRDKSDIYRWREEIARVFAPTPWAETARAVFAALS